MDMNITLAIPVTGAILLINLVVNILRFLHIRKNGVEAAMLTDLKDGQKNCTECFKELNISSTKSEVHLETIVTQLQLLNTNFNRRNN